MKFNQRQNQTQDKFIRLLKQYDIEKHIQVLCLWFQKPCSLVFNVKIPEFRRILFKQNKWFKRNL